MEGDAAGSTEIGGYCPHDLAAFSTSTRNLVQIKRYDSLLASPTPKGTRRWKLHDYCSADTMETKMMIAEKMLKITRKAFLLYIGVFGVSCLPCAGVFFSANVVIARSIEKS